MVTAIQAAYRREPDPHPENGADHGHSRILDAKKRSSIACHFEEALRKKIVGQEQAVQALVDLYQVFCAGLHSPGRPVGNLLFLGPTGSGKTRTVEAAAEILFGDSRAMIKVDCAEFQHSHEIAKFHPLKHAELDDVLEIELRQVQK
jgi:transcriptional regulator with AAA-type ATPase domain